MEAETLFLIGYGLIFMGTIFCAWRIEKLIKDHYPDIWGIEKKEFAFKSFIKNREYRSLNDSKLTKYCIGYLVLSWAINGILIVVFGWALIFTIKHLLN
jgi:hypothetical protein